MKGSFQCLALFAGHEPAISVDTANNRFVVYQRARCSERLDTCESKHLGLEDGEDSRQTSFQVLVWVLSTEVPSPGDGSKKEYTKIMEVFATTGLTS